MSVRTYVYKGREYRLYELAKHVGVDAKTLKGRIDRGLTIDQAIAKQPRTQKIYEYHGELLTLKQIAERSRISCNAIRERLHKGWTIEDAADLPVGARACEKTGKQKKNRPACCPRKNASAAERSCWEAALKIFHKIGAEPDDWDFRCITPASEYAFESDILGWKISFAPDLRTAYLTAHYKKHGFDSDFRRTFHVIDDSIQEVEIA